MNRPYLRGMRDGLPIALAYLAVSFGFGILARQAGISTGNAVLISASNLTSAGQTAAVGIIAAGGTLLEMLLAQFIINLRYSLMGLSLSQKLSPKFTVGHRLLASFGITDEIFALMIRSPGPVEPRYMYGATHVAVIGWVLGTFLGAFSGSLLPEHLLDAMGILLYGMFIAIVVPPAKREKPVMFCALIAVGLSCLIYFCLPAVSSGFSIILSALGASLLIAWLRPLPDDGGDAEHPEADA